MISHEGTNDGQQFVIKVSPGFKAREHHEQICLEPEELESYALDMSA